MKKLTLPDYQALAEFRYQIRKFLHFSERAVHAEGLERGQYQLMLAIKGMPEGVRPRREVVLALTPKGERVLAELALHHQDELRSAAPDLVGALRRLMPERGVRKAKGKNSSAAKAGGILGLTRP